MTIGGFNKDMHIKGEKIQSFYWNEYSNYEIKIPGIYVGGDYHNNAVDTTNYRFMFDSGTTYIWLPTKIIKSLYVYINNYCSDPKARKAGEKRCIGISPGKKLEIGTANFYNLESGLEGGLDAYLNSYPKL
jgi:hypothetical protein